MIFTLAAVSMMMILSCVCASAATESQVERTLFEAGFEDNDDSITRWVEHGDITVNFAGLSEERAFKGR